MDEIYNLIGDFPNKIKNAYSTNVDLRLKKFDKMIFFGMGGSYISSLVLKEFLNEKIFVEVNPSNFFVDSSTLFVLISYSGNTKEILVVLEKLKNRTRNILILSSGGELGKKAEKYDIDLIKIPCEIHQRFTFAYVFFPLLKLFEKSDLTESKLKCIWEILNAERKNIEKITRNLANKINDKNLLIYASPFFYPVAYRFQTAVEEDAKTICHSNKISELFHNELEALPDKRFFPILILDKKEMKNYDRQIQYFKKKLNSFYEFGFEKYSKEERIFLAFYFIDFFGYYLSKIKKADMGQTPLSDKIKKL
ncbi:MAG: SIS domain-containing protein [Nanoarchaeota archaeon]